MKTYVYIAGPINSSGIQNRNVRRACEVAERLRAAGLIPFLPHLNVLWDTICPEASDEEWLAWDFAWLEKCDVLVRIPGVSRGADREVALAMERGIPVYHEDRIPELIAWACGRAEVSR